MSDRPTPEQRAAGVYHLLQQDTLWTTIDGTTIPIINMELRHARNCVNFMLRRAGSLQFYYGLALAMLGHPDDHELAIIIDQFMDEPPAAWLMTTPLMKALAARANTPDPVHPTRPTPVHIEEF